ncbi:MAG: ribose-phosphate diphosphokinase [Candidatus Caldarchaeum sp.]|nr:ribose-phosphate diphosphokinase [Candidatus Caldarchaeum sp.]
MKGPSSKQLAEKIARYANVETVDVVEKVFPDGEAYVRVVGEVDDDVVLVHGLHPPQDANLVKLLLLADAVKAVGAKNIKAVIPYMAYARQDRRFLEGEPVSVHVVLRALKAAGVDEVFTVNIHSPWIASESPVKLINIDASGLLASYVIQTGVERPFVVSPGKKGGEMAEAVAEVMETDHAVLRTSRNPETGEVSVTAENIPTDREIIIVDDVISTGTTVIKSIQLLKKFSPTKLVVAAVHGLFIDSAAEKILSAGADVLLTTDTVPNPYGYASVAGLIASHLSRLSTL